MQRKGRQKWSWVFLSQFLLCWWEISQWIGSASRKRLKNTLVICLGGVAVSIKTNTSIAAVGTHRRPEKQQHWMMKNTTHSSREFSVLCVHSRLFVDRNRSCFYKNRPEKWNFYEIKFFATYLVTNGNYFDISNDFANNVNA